MLYLYIARLEDVLLDISNQIHQEVNRILLQLGYPILSSEKAASLKGQLRSLADKNNAVRTIIGEFMMGAFLIFDAILYFGRSNVNG